MDHPLPLETEVEEEVVALVRPKSKKGGGVAGRTAEQVSSRGRECESKVETRTRGDYKKN